MKTTENQAEQKCLQNSVSFGNGQLQGVYLNTHIRVSEGCHISRFNNCASSISQRMFISKHVWAKMFYVKLVSLKSK